MKGFRLKVVYSREEKIAYFKKLIVAAHEAIERWMNVIDRLEDEILLEKSKAEKTKEGKES